MKEGASSHDQWCKSERRGSGAIGHVSPVVLELTECWAAEYRMSSQGDGWHVKEMVAPEAGSGVSMVRKDAEQ